MSQSNALHAFVLQQMMPVQLAGALAKAELAMREQTVRSVFHEQAAPAVIPVDEDQE